MITKSKMKQIAKDLIGPTGVFSDFLSDCVLTKKTGFNYNAQTNTNTKQTLRMVNAKLVKEGSKENKETEVIELIGLYEDLTLSPNPDDTTFSYDGMLYKFLSIDIDPAKATITLRGTA